MKYFKETLYDSVCQEFRIDKLYFESRTEHQHLMIFHNAALGRVMTLDGVVQTTEADEFIYHEMMAHVPVIAHGDVRKVLIIGGGDGGMLREVLRHPDIEATQVEIDQAVIDMSKQYLPDHSRGAFDNPRATIIIDDGINFVRNSTEQFDVIISDSTDPIGPGEILFTEDFYSLARERLTPGGILVTQNGVPFFQPDEVITTNKRLSKIFSDHAFYAAAIPTYYGGIMTFAWASDNHELRNLSLETLRKRYEDSGIKTRYYNPEIHLGSFALPQYLLDSITEKS
jgi:spermidine synthase